MALLWLAVAANAQERDRAREQLAAGTSPMGDIEVRVVTSDEARALVPAVEPWPGPNLQALAAALLPEGAPRNDRAWRRRRR